MTGSGSAALLEDRPCDRCSARPSGGRSLPGLVWRARAGRIWLGLFRRAHAELLDRTLALLQVDCLGHPQDGRTANISITSTSYDRFGDEQLPSPDALSGLAEAQGIALARGVEYGLVADHNNFDAFNVPNADLIYFDQKEYRLRGNAYIHYSMHWHDPYDTVELAEEMGDVLVEMTRIALRAALETGRTQAAYRLAPSPERRALFVASHTESITLPPAMLRDLGMALAWEGFDVDIIPHGQALSEADLKQVDLVVLPPTVDYRLRRVEAWSARELRSLENYVREGGLLAVVEFGL